MKSHSHKWEVRVYADLTTTLESLFPDDPAQLQQFQVQRSRKQWQNITTNKRDNIKPEEKLQTTRR